MTLHVPEQFRAALNYLLKQEGRGAQALLADQLGIDRGYLSAIVKGRKSGSEKKRVQIASHFSMTYEDMLGLGRRILEGDENNPPISEDKENVSVPEVQGAEKELTADLLSNIQQVIDVLESDTVYSDVLARMIDVFHYSIRLKKENQALHALNVSLEERLSKLEKQSRVDNVDSCIVPEDNIPDPSSQKENDQNTI